MRAYPEYKASGVEWIEAIPSGWYLEKLKFKADIQFSNVDKLSDESEIPVFLCNYVDVYKNEKIHSGIDFMRATANVNEVKKFQIKKGDVIITKDSESVDDIAVPALVIEDFNNVLCGYHLAQIKSKKDLSGYYLFRLFQSKDFNQNFESSANGMTRYGLSVFSIKNVVIPIPTPQEQQAIVNFLDYKTRLIDNFIANRQLQQKLLKEQKAGIINKAVTKGINPHANMKPSGIEWLPEIPVTWDVWKMKFLSRIETGNKNTEDAEENGIYPFYVRSDKVEKISSYSFEGEAILTAGDGVGVAKVYHYANSKMAIHQRVYKISHFKRVLGEFLYFYIKDNFEKEVIKLSAKTTVDSLRMPMLANFPVAYPDKDEQKLILEYIRVVVPL